MEADRRRSRYPWYRGALVLLAINGCTAVLLARRLGSRDAILADAAVIAVLATAAAVTAFRYPRRWAPYAVLAVAMALSRNILLLSQGRLFGVRDAALHVFRIPLAIIETGHVPAGTSYSTFPMIHVLLAGLSLETGLPLWVAQAVAATLLALCGVGLVALLTRSIAPAPAAPVVAGALFLGDPSVIPAGQLFQPLSFSVVMLALLAVLAHRMRTHHLSRTLLAVTGVLLAMAHPYSATIVMTVLLVAGITDLAVNRRPDLLVIAGVGVAVTFLYAGLVANRLDFFLNIFSTGDQELATSATAGTAQLPVPAALRLDSGVALAVFYGLAVLGWGERLFRARRLDLTIGHQLAAGLAVLAVLAYAFPILIGGRILMLLAVVTAPFGAHLLTSLKAGALATGILVPALVVASMTGVFAVYQFTPWAQRVVADQPLANEPVRDSLAQFLTDRAHWVPYGFFPLYTSHFVQFEGRSLDGHGLGASLDAHPSRSLVLVWSTESPRYGYGDSTNVRTPSGQPDTFTPYPTAGQLALVTSSDRLGQFGPYLVARM